VSRPAAVRDLKVRYGSEVVLDVAHLRFRPGATLVVAGASGAGKSTLGHAVAGLLPYLGARVSGELTIGEDRFDLADRKALRRLRGSRVRWIPQDPARAFTPTRPLLDQMLEGIPDPDRVEERLARLLKVLGLPEASALAERCPFEFSGGMLQRAAVISAFLPSPDLVVADEPTAHLDAPRTLVLAKIITSLSRATKVSVLWVTHDLRLAAAVADRMVFLDRGLVQAEGEPADLLRTTGEDVPPLVAATARLALPL